MFGSYRDTLKVTKEYLDEHPKTIFVFGDNTDRAGKGGAAILRDHPQAYGFITKIHPGGADEDFYDAVEYLPIYICEIIKLCKQIENLPNHTFLITALGAGLANRFQIWEDLVFPSIREVLSQYENVQFTWEAT